jgi:hypothetical protein
MFGDKAPAASTEGLNNHNVVGKSQVTGQRGVARYINKIAAYEGIP